MYPVDRGGPAPAEKGFVVLLLLTAPLLLAENGLLTPPELGGGITPKLPELGAPPDMGGGATFDTTLTCPYLACNSLSFDDE